MNKRITRRQLLKVLGTAAAGYGLGLGKTHPAVMARSMAQGSVAEIPLQAGWNLISMPLSPDGPALPGVLASIAGQYDMVYEYDAAGGGQPWRYYNPNIPGLLNTLSALDIRWGYWIRATQATTLTLVGTPPASTTIPLAAGWNLVGYPSDQARPVSEALAGLAGNYTEVRAFTGGAWQTYIPGGTATLTELVPGQGYWLRVTNPTNWIVPGASTGMPKVIHMHSEGATSWDGSTVDYWNYVNQNVVNDMVDQGVMALTGASAVADAWRALIPTYQPGQAIAIKVNLNNSFACNEAGGKIDALIQPVNAVVRGLKQIGVAEMDIWVYDAIRAMPDRFVAGSQYGEVRLFNASWLTCQEPAYFTNGGVTFAPPSGIPAPTGIQITDVLVNATYLINIPIMKLHSPTSTGISLSFKNHFGTINQPGNLHDHVTFGGSYFRTDYSAFVDLYSNVHIVGKTVLTIGDGLFAANRVNGPPSPWATFGNQVPNSLFFAVDPVAIDSVMCDLLDTEFSIPVQSDNYLRLAADSGLGVFERGDPWGDGYSRIDYVYFES